MDLILRTGDQAIFDSAFGPAQVIAGPGVIMGSSRAKIDGAAVCVQGDEGSVIVTGASYSVPPLAGGIGILTISALASDQTAQKGNSGRRALLLRGSKFQARLQVVTPATAGNSADTTTTYSGTGTFVAANTKVKAT